MGCSIRWVAGAALLGLAMLVAAAPVSAQNRRDGERRAATRLRVTPAPLPPSAYRQCVDWYDLEHRPSGDVIVPKMRCWWVRG